jgi:hypothetical protein
MAAPARRLDGLCLSIGSVGSTAPRRPRRRSAETRHQSAGLASAHVRPGCVGSSSRRAWRQADRSRRAQSCGAAPQRCRACAKLPRSTPWPAHRMPPTRIRRPRLAIASLPTAGAVFPSYPLTSAWLLVSMRGEEQLRISSHQPQPRATSARPARSPIRRAAGASLRTAGPGARPPSLRASSTCRRSLAGLPYRIA